MIGEADYKLVRLQILACKEETIRINGRLRAWGVKSLLDIPTRIPIES